MKLETISMKHGLREFEAQINGALVIMIIGNEITKLEHIYSKTCD